MSGRWRAIDALLAAEAAPRSVLVRAIDAAGNVGGVVSLARAETPDPLTVQAGEQLLVQAGGFQPGQRVRVELHSDPVILATVTASANGTVATFVTIPAGLSGGAFLIPVRPR